MDYDKLTYNDWKALAEKKLDSECFSYLSSGAGFGTTVIENYESFRRWKFLPRVASKSLSISIKCTVLGREISAPIMLGPVRGQKYFYRSGEIASASAARRLGIPFILSNFASTTIEDLASVMNDTPHFLQLYPCKDEELIFSFVKRAKLAGYAGIFLTVDMAGHSTHYAGPKTLEYERFGMDIYFSDPVFQAKLQTEPNKDREAALKLWNELRKTTFTWENIREFIKKSDLPVILKGILNPLDVQECINSGAAGIVVSNHGGRSVEGTEAPIDILSEIVDVSKGKLLVLLDSGIRTGAEVVKSLALGAKCVLLGRSYIYPLAVAGEEGVFVFVKKMVREIVSTMMSLGCSDLSELGPQLVRRI